MPPEACKAGSNRQPDEKSSFFRATVAGKAPLLRYNWISPLNTYLILITLPSTLFTTAVGRLFAIQGQKVEKPRRKVEIARLACTGGRTRTGPGSCGEHAGISTTHIAMRCSPRRSQTAQNSLISSGTPRDTLT